MGGFLFDQLEECRDAGELVALFRLGDESVLIGFVTRLTGGQVELQTVDDSGRGEGKIVVPLGRLHGVHRGTAHLIGLGYLHRLSTPIPRRPGRVARSPQTVLGALRRALESASVVTVRQVNEMPLIGLVRAMDGAFVQIEVLANGIADGFLTLALPTIQSVTEGSERELREQTLYRAASGL